MEDYESAAGLHSHATRVQRARALLDYVEEIQFHFAKYREKECEGKEIEKELHGKRLDEILMVMAKLLYGFTKGAAPQ